MFQLIRQILHGMNRIRGAYRNTRSTVDAAGWFDIQLGRCLETRFILLRVNATGRAYVDAEKIFNTGIRNYIGHGPAPKEEFQARSRVQCGKAMFCVLRHKWMCAANSIDSKRWRATDHRIAVSIK